jgi:hypothetical protein
MGVINSDEFFVTSPHTTHDVEILFRGDDESAVGFEIEISERLEEVPPVLSIPEVRRAG